ncbi:MAG TPA: outer membrane beta-barrel protein [Bacteroidales bacterium]
MKKLLILLFIIQTSVLFGQRGYYAKDTLMCVGVELVDGGSIQNAKQCQIKQKDKTLVFSPDEVKEYGFDNERVYFSRIIHVDNSEKRVFLERICKGKINLYYYRDKHGRRFFIENDTTRLIELRKKPGENYAYKELLKIYVQDCADIWDVLQFTAFNKLALSKFINQYNECKVKPFPFFKFGVFVGYGSTKPANAKLTDELLEGANFNNDYSFSVGASMDIPIMYSNFSIHPEICYQKNAFSSHYETKSSINDVIINVTTVNIPFLIRYTCPSFKVRPFINFGSVFSYNIRNSNTIYSSTVSNNVIEIGEGITRNIYSKKQIGYSIGGGIQYHFGYKRSVFIEFRYHNLSGLTTETFGSKSVQIITGLNF